jgi:murein DD-endopeptidase MepM/ murein hydrolase activator NlpD
VRRRAYNGRHRAPVPVPESGNGPRHAPRWVLAATAAAATVALATTGAALLSRDVAAATAPTRAAGIDAQTGAAPVTGGRERHPEAVEARIASERAARAQRRHRESPGTRPRGVRTVRTVSARRWVAPTHGRVTSGFGRRWGTLHAGVDFAVPPGTRLHAMSSGRVVRAGWDVGGGLMVSVRQWDGTVIEFLHLSRLVVRAGQHVSAGQLVGYSGSTGHSTGPHLHLEVHPRGGAAVNPLPWLAAHHVRI